MNKTFILTLLALLLYSHTWAAVPEGAEVPPNWFRKANGYEEALILQDETGADVLVYIANLSDKNKKGLCRWFERKALKNFVVSKYVKRNFIKVHLEIPSNKDTLALAESLRMYSGPTLIVISPDGRNSKINPFLWVQKRPTLKKPEVLVEEIKNNSSTF